MPSDDSSGSRPAAPIVVRIKLRYDDVEAMVQRFATNVGKSGLFLPTKSVQPLGAEIKFELRLADDTPALVGLGRVRSATPPDPRHPRATFGMTIELMRVTPQSRALILRMLEQRRAQGLPEVSLPTADDIDAARRAEAAVAREPSGPLPVTPLVASPTVSSKVSSAVSSIVPGDASRIDPPPGESLLTAPRRSSGPIASAKILAVAPLAPEPPRRKRLAVREIIESASGPIASVSVAMPGIDDDVDMSAALSRARRLAGHALDAELEALCEAAAAPVEISIEAASAELARHLGGSAVRRDRSARWAPPPATTVPAPAAAPAASRAEPRRDRDAVPEPIVDAPDARPEAAEARTAVAVARDDAPAESVESAGESEPEPIAAEIHQLHGPDLDEVERTETGDIPVAPDGSDHQGFATEPSPSDQRALGARLEAELADEEGEAAAEDRALARALAEAYREPAPGHADRAAGEPAMDVSLEEIDDFEILAEADADDEDLLAAHGEHDISGSRDAIMLPPAEARAPSELDFASRLDLGDDSDRYDAPSGDQYAPSADEFSAHHVLDALPDDLAGQRDAFTGPARLAPHLESARQALAVFDTGDEPLDDSEEPTGVALDPGVQPIFEPEPSNSFTMPRAPSEPSEHEVPVRRPESVSARRAARAQPALGSGAQPGSAPRVLPDSAPKAQPAIDARAPSAIAGTSQPILRPGPREPAVLRSSPFLPSLLDSPVEDYELEHALEALDVDLDDLAIPHAATQLQRNTDPGPRRSTPSVSSAPAPATIRPASPSRAPQPQLQPQAPAAVTPSRPHRQTGAPDPAGAPPSRSHRQTGAPAPAAAAPPSRSHRQTGAPDPAAAPPSRSHRQTGAPDPAAAPPSRSHRQTGAPPPTPAAPPSRSHRQTGTPAPSPDPRLATDDSVLIDFDDDD